MGWYDAFGGHTERVNVGAVTGGAAARNFGDAFASIGTTLIAADAQAGKNKLLELQLQNEQNKLDDAANVRADKNTQEYAASMTRDAWGKDKAASVAALDTTASPEATLNAQQAIDSFYTPTKEMKAEWTGQEKVVQDNNNKAYLAGAFNFDPKLSKEERKAEDDKLRGLYKPETAQLAEIEKRFKAQDDLAQVNFNNELREQATNYKTFDEFQKSPDYKTLLTNADAVGIEHVIDRFKLNDKDAAALRKTNAEINHYENADSIAQGELDLKRTKESREAWEFKHPQAKGDTRDRIDKEKDIIKSIDTTINGAYGKTDAQGVVSIGGIDAKKAAWLRGRSILYVSQGHDAASALTQAGNDFTRTVTQKKDGELIAKVQPKKAAKTADPLGLR